MKWKSGTKYGWGIRQHCCKEAAAVTWRRSSWDLEQHLGEPMAKKWLLGSNTVATSLCYHGSIFQ